MRFQTRAIALLAGGRYVFVSGSPFAAGSGVLINGRTTRRQAVSAPGCRASALGGRWLAFTCGAAPSQTFELYDIPTRRMQPFTATVPYADCITNCLPIAAIGTHWVTFQAPASDPHVLPTFAFQNITTGTTTGDPTNAITNIDLNSQMLTAKVCRPLRIPTVSNAYSSGWGSLTFDHGFAITAGSGGAHLQRCGSRHREFLTFTTPNGNTTDAGCAHLACAPAHNSRAIVWQTAAGRLNGLFLPSRQKFTIHIPLNVDANQPGSANGDQYRLALTPKRLYLQTPDGKIWSTVAPARSRPTHARVGA